MSYLVNIKNTDKRRRYVPFYKSNQVKGLNTDESLSVIAANESELSHYLQLNGNYGFIVTYNEKCGNKVLDTVYSADKKPSEPEISEVPEETTEVTEDETSDNVEDIEKVLTQTDDKVEEDVASSSDNMLDSDDVIFNNTIFTVDDNTDDSNTNSVTTVASDEEKQPKRRGRRSKK